MDGRRVLVTNAWTNTGPQQLVKMYEMMGVAVCALELGTLSPIMLVQTREHPAVERFPTTATGNPRFDDRFILATSPGIDGQVMTPQVQELLLAHEDWAFAGDEYWLACVSRGAFQSADDVSGRLDEMMGLAAAFPTSVVPSEIDRSADDLAARIRRLSKPEDVIAFLQQLGSDDRQRLADSDTPLAAFADVTSWDQVMTRLQSLDVQQRMQLLAMFKRARDNPATD